MCVKYHGVSNDQKGSRQRGPQKYLGIIYSGVRFWGVGPPCCIARTCLLAILHELRKHRELHVPVHSKSELALAYWAQQVGCARLWAWTEASIELDGLS